MHIFILHHHLSSCAFQSKNTMGTVPRDLWSLLQICRSNFYFRISNSWGYFPLVATLSFSWLLLGIDIAIFMALFRHCHFYGSCYYNILHMLMRCFVVKKIHQHGNKLLSLIVTSRVMLYVESLYCSRIKHRYIIAIFNKGIEWP